MASINKILGGNLKNKTLNKASYVAKMIHYSQFVNSDMQFYDFGREKSEAVADNLELAGAILEPVVARQIDAEKYEIVCGHKRIGGVKILVEERGLEKFTMVPTLVIKVDDCMAEYILISTNDYPEKSDYERMMEVVRLYEILPKIKAEECTSARVLRRMVAREDSMCETRVGNFKNIYNHFSEKSMAAFKAEMFGINVAIKLASLPEKEQDKLVDRGHLTISDVNEYIESKNTATESSKSGPGPSQNVVKDTAISKNEPEELNSFVSNDTVSGEKRNDDTFSAIEENAESGIAFESNAVCDTQERTTVPNNSKNVSIKSIAAQLIVEARYSSIHSKEPREQIKSQIIATAIQYWLDNTDLTILSE